jgi:hypothetical protein
MLGVYVNAYIHIVFSVLDHAGTRKICNSLSTLPYLYKSAFTNIQHLLQYTENFIANNFKIILLKKGKLILCIFIRVFNGICFAVSELYVY